jgi:hypothetical protein
LIKNLRASNAMRAAAMAASRTILIVAVVAIVAVAGIATVILIGGSNDDDGPRITVTAPTAGSSYAPGTDLTIHWTSKGNVGDTVKIQVSYQGGAMSTVADETPNNGTYVIDIPTGVSGRTDYFIRVTSNLNASVYGESGQFTISGDMTPTVSYSYEETAEGNYTFTIMAISRNDVLRSALTIEVTPSVGEGHVSGWSGSGEHLAAEDSFTVGWMMPGATYDVVVRYLPTMGAILDAHVLVGGTPSPQVGQYINYTVGVTINNDTGTHEGQGYLMIVVTSVNATTVVYNSTLSVTIDDVRTVQQSDLARNWSTGFGGFDVNYPWGSKLCKQYEAWAESGRTGYYWMLDSVMLKGDKVTYQPGGAVAEYVTYQIADTNLTSITG